MRAFRGSNGNRVNEDQAAARQEQPTKSVLGFVPYIGWLAHLVPGTEMRESSNLQVTMFLQPVGEKQTQIRLTMQKDGEPVWDQVMIDKLWVTTQREAMIESGPPPANPVTPSPPADKAGEKVSEPTPKLLKMTESKL